MSDQDARPPESADNASYDVGYKRPPVAHRFQKGISGNPRGRPKKPATVSPENAIAFNHQAANQLLLKEAYRPVTITEDGKQIEIPMIQAVFRAITVAAAKGNRFAQRALADHLERIETDRREQRAEFFQMMIQHQSEAEQAIAEARWLGRPEPTILPHPADIKLNLVTAELSIVGPITPEQKARCDALLAHRQELAELTEDARQACLSTEPSELDERLEHWQALRKAMRAIEGRLPPSYKERLRDRLCA